MVKSRKVKNIFQSTPSVGRATTIYNADIHLICISIHALRGEGDVRALELFGHRQGISIHALRGEGDDTDKFILKTLIAISIHALRGEGDLNRATKKRAHSVFQSTPSVGRATIIDSFFICLKIFQSTPSVGRAT